MVISCVPTDISRATEGTASLLPPEVSREIWGLAHSASAIMSAARHIRLPGAGLVFPVVTGNAEADWVGETCSKPVGQSTFDTRIMRPYKLAVIEIFSDEFRRDLPGLYRELARQLPYALAAKFDATVLGQSPAPGDDFDTLEEATTVNFTGKTAIQGLLEAQRDVAEAGGRISAWLAEPQLESALLGSAVGNGWQNPFSPGNPGVAHVLGAPVYPVAPGTMLPYTGAAGDFARGAIFGSVGGIHIAYSDQATVGNTNLWQQNMFAIRAEVEVGFILRDPKLFVRFTGEPDDANGAGGFGSIGSLDVNADTVDVTADTVNVDGGSTRAAKAKAALAE